MTRRLPHALPRLLAASIGALALCVAAASAQAQSLTVMPVTVQMAPGQMATTLTVVNQSATEASFQIRAFAWTQGATGDDELAPTDELVASPPLGTMAANATQVVRLVLRRPPQGREASYRIWLDQIPPAAAAGTVRIALRLSIPIFAEPSTRIAPHLAWRIGGSGAQTYLEAVNDGGRHESVRDINLASAGGVSSKVEANVSPYVLAGATRRWRILTPVSSPIHLTAHADNGVIDQQVQVSAGP
jgi:fimbrial chaperone protein